MSDPDLTRDLSRRPHPALRKAPSARVAHELLRDVHKLLPKRVKTSRARDAVPSILLLVVRQTSWLQPLARALRSVTEADQNLRLINPSKSEIATWKRRLQRDPTASDQPRHRQDPPAGHRRDFDLLWEDADAGLTPGDLLAIILPTAAGAKTTGDPICSTANLWDPSEPDIFCESLARLRTAGIRVVILAPNEDALPPYARLAIDQVIPIEAVSGTILRGLSFQMFQSAPPVIDDIPGPIDPLQLDLAYRPGATLEQYFQELRKFAGQSLLPAPSSPSSFPQRLDDLRGMDEAVAWGRDLIADLADLRAGRIAWAEIDRGCVLAGPPGTGKTRFAELLAREAGLGFVAGSAATWQAAGNLSEFLIAQKAAFEEAADKAPSILLIDELDAFWSRTARSDHNGYYASAVITSLLEHLDGIKDRGQVIAIGATNHLGRIDAALLRPGRFDRVITIPVPSYDHLLAIFRYYTGDLFSDEQLEPCVLKALEHHATGANIEQWTRAMKRRARRANQPPVIADLENALGLAPHDIVTR